MSLLEGDLRSSSLERVVQEAGQQQLTGILTIQGQGDIVAVSFLQGQIVSADALNQTVEEGLGRVLIQQGLMNRESLAELTEQAQGLSLGDVAVQRGLLDRSQLLQALRLLTYELIVRLLSWRNGEYKFYLGDEVAYEDGFAPISFEEIRVREMEAQGKELPDLAAVYRKDPKIAPPKVLGRDSGDDLNAEDKGWLTASENSLLMRMDGVRSAAAVAEELGLSYYQGVYSLERLVQKGFATLLSEHSGVLSRNQLQQYVELELPRRMDTEVFVPPDGEETGDDTMSALGPLLEEDGEAAADDEPAPWHGWLAGALGLALGMVVLLGLFEKPLDLLLPMPWQEESRQSMADLLRRSQYERIDRGARTLFLLDAHFPDSLEDLVGIGAIAASDLRDSTGRLLDYQGADVSYRLGPFQPGQPPESLERQVRHQGDFHLDPGFASSPQTTEPPIYLID